MNEVYIEVRVEQAIVHMLMLISARTAVSAPAHALAILFAGCSPWHWHRH